MITDLFTIEEGKVTPTIHCHLIPEFKYIIDKYGDRAVSMLAYAFYMSCPHKSINPYADMSEEDREEVLKDDFCVLPDNVDILNAREKIASLYDTMSTKQMISIKKSLFKTMEYLDNVSIRDGIGGNIGDIHRMQKEAGKILESYLMLEKAAEDEMNKMKTKANRSIGLGEL